MKTLKEEGKRIPVGNSKLIKARFNSHHTGFLKVTAQAAYIAGDNFNFVQASQNGVNIQAGVGKNISIQSMATHGPFHMKMTWPLNLLAGPFSMPQAIPYPPFVHLLPEIGPFMSVMAGLSFCYVAEELYGKNDIRTHHARLYTMIHDNFFIRLYKKNGKKWANFLNKYTWLKPIVKPIWDYMANEGFKISKNCVFVNTGVRI